MSDFYIGNDNDDKNSYQKMIAMCVAAASLVMLIFLLVLYINAKKDNDNRRKEDLAAKNNAVSEEDEFEVGKSNLTSQDLHFWDDYHDYEQFIEDTDGDYTPYINEQGDSTNEEGPDIGQTEEGLSKDESSVSDENMDDGKHICVEDREGKKTWYEILDNVPKNTYNFDEFLEHEGERVKYNGEGVHSVTGIDLSKYNGDIDFALVRESNISFAMLRLGLRGYTTGALAIDEKFVEYAQNALANGIPIGAYFYSQAINVNEAIEEANYVIGATANFGLTYPIAIDVEKMEGEEARANNLSMSERTAIVKAFCDTVRSFGKVAVIYADRNMLISGLNMEDLAGYDIWLSDRNIPSDFPYKYSMWQYSQSGSVNGINGSVDLDICFTEY